MSANNAESNDKNLLSGSMTKALLSFHPFNFSLNGTLRKFLKIFDSKVSSFVSLHETDTIDNFENLKRFLDSSDFCFMDDVNEDNSCSGRRLIESVDDRKYLDCVKFKPRLSIYACKHFVLQKIINKNCVLLKECAVKMALIA